MTERYEPSFYHVPNLLQESHPDNNPTFIVYGDSQPAWRLEKRFIAKRNWTSNNMFIFPFYQLYLFGNGLYGAFNWILNKPDFGSDTRIMMRDAVHKEAKRCDAGFILNTGDIMGQDGRRPAHWALFLKDYNRDHPILKEIPYLPTIGNHERWHDGRYAQPNYEAVFDYPPFYKLDFPDAALFVINSNVIIDYKDDVDDIQQQKEFEKWFISDDPEHPGWLERELKSCNKPFKMVSMHHPPFSFGHHWKDWYKAGYGSDILAKRRKLIQLFQDSGVQVVFSGHDHIYQHSILNIHPEVGSNISEIHFIVSSGGGTTIREASSERKKTMLRKRYISEGYVVRPVLNIGVYHYCLVTVKPNELRIRTIEVSEESGHPTRELDQITIARPG